VQPEGGLVLVLVLVNAGSNAREKEDHADDWNIGISFIHQAIPNEMGRCA
jgi:hypothetical protein